jgi:NAD(P)H-nitrite reductase large subunit
MRYVIIGSGPAGVIAAETLRKLDSDGKITLLGDEPEPPYSRMALPYYLVQRISEQGTYLRKSQDHFDKAGIELEIERVVRVDADGHRLFLESGSTLDYDRLLIATGSSPVSPPIPGMDLPGIFSCWTLADGRNIASRAKPGSRVLLMGAGFIGCIILQALAKSGADLTVVEMGDRMVPRMMNEKAGNLIKQWCIDKGVEVHTSTRVTQIESEGSVSSPVLNVTLENGQTMACDLVVSATGVRPNTAFLDGSGVRIEEGILVNRQMQTSVPDIYAAGDVAQGLDFSTGGYSVQAIQPTASEHGQIAARNMAGMTGALHNGNINMNVLDTLGLVSSSFGLWMGVEGGDCAELYNPDRYQYLNLQFSDDILIGATSLGLTQHVGVLRGLIQSRIRLGKWKETLKHDPTVIMQAYLANTQAIGHNASIL